MRHQPFPFRFGCADVFLVMAVATRELVDGQFYLAEHDGTSEFWLVVETEDLVGLVAFGLLGDGFDRRRGGSWSWLLDGLCGLWAELAQVAA